MKKRLLYLGRVLGGLFILMLVFLTALIGYTMFWEQQQRERLAAGSMMIETDRGAMEYVEFGSGPAILTIHGSPGGYDGGVNGSEFWVKAGFRYLSPSRPGYLRTSLTVGETFEGQADAYAALLDALAIDKVAIIAGSGGGPSALQFALRHPERCSSLVLISAIVQRREFTEAERAVINLESTSLVGWLFTTLITQKPEWIFPALDPALAPNGDPHQYDDYVAITAGSLPMGPRHEGWLNDFEQMARMSDYPLAEITCPTLIVHGYKDANAPLSGAEYAAATIPNAEFLKLDGDHLALVAQMEEVMPKIADFLESHTP